MGLPSVRPPQEEPRFLRCDWHRAVADGVAGISDLHADVIALEQEAHPEAQQLLADALVCKICQFLWGATDQQGCVRVG